MPIGSVAAIMANLDSKVVLIEKGAEAGLIEFGHHVAHLTSQAAPVVTGALRDSWLGGPNGVNEEGLVIGRDEHGPFVLVGSNLPYASKIEYEDTAMLRPALHQSEDDLHVMVKTHVHTTARLGS